MTVVTNKPAGIALSALTAASTSEADPAAEFQRLVSGLEKLEAQKLTGWKNIGASYLLNPFSKKDDQLKKDVAAAKEGLAQALADGVISPEESASLIELVANAEKAFDSYSKLRKVVGGVVGNLAAVAAITGVSEGVVKGIDLAKWGFVIAAGANVGGNAAVRGDDYSKKDVVTDAVTGAALSKVGSALDKKFASKAVSAGEFHPALKQALQLAMKFGILNGVVSGAGSLSNVDTWSDGIGNGLMDTAVNTALSGGIGAVTGGVIGGAGGRLASSMGGVDSAAAKAVNSTAVSRAASPVVTDVAKPESVETVDTEAVVEAADAAEPQAEATEAAPVEASTAEVAPETAAVESAPESVPVVGATAA